MKSFLLLSFSSLSHFLYSCSKNNKCCRWQIVDAISPAFFNVVGGEPVVSVRFAKLVAGTPYFTNEWMKGNVTTKNGALFSGVYLNTGPL